MCIIKQQITILCYKLLWANKISEKNERTREIIHDKWPYSDNVMLWKNESYPLSQSVTEDTDIENNNEFTF